MGKLLNLELPSSTDIPAEFLRSLNERFLAIAEQLKLATIPAAVTPDPATPATTQPVSTRITYQGPHGLRFAQPPVAGREFYETDRTLVYVGDGLQWNYRSGIMRATLANKPTPTLQDAGLLFFATDYRHTWRWDGAAWDWAPGDDGSDFFRDYRSDPGTGWHLCDGAAGVVVTRSDTTTATLTVPDLTTGAYRKGGAAYTGTVTAAGTIALAGDTGDTSGGTPAGTVSAPTFTGSGGTTNSVSGGTPAGTNSAPTLTMNSYSPAGVVGSITNTYNLAAGAVTVVSTVGAFTGTPATLTGSVAAPTFTGSALGTHSHTVTAAGTNSAPTFTGSALAVHHHDLSGATATFVGDPVKNLAILPYFRQ